MKRPELNDWSIKAFIVVFLIIVSLMSILLIWIERTGKINELAEMKTKEQWSVQMEYSLIYTRLSSLISDVSYLHDAYEDQLIDTAKYDRITRDWIVFSNKRHIYDQIRFIDAAGNEKIRVDFNSRGAVKVPDAALQNKKDRYYFYEAAALPEGALHISPLDLNIEHNEIEIPHKPMIRLGMPIHALDGRLSGVLVVNYLADDFLDLFNRYDQTTPGHIMLINDKGYYLSSYDKTMEWGFMFSDGKDRRFDVTNPQEWQDLQNGIRQVVTDKGLFTFLPVNLAQIFNQEGKYSFLPKTVSTKDSWYIVSWIPKDTTNDFLYYDDYGHLFKDIATQMMFSVLLLLAVVIAGIMSRVLCYYQRIHFRAEYDPLTKAYSRQGGMAKLRTLYHSAKFSRALNLSICFIDVNGLKTINDTLGHTYGDEMITTAIQTVQAEIRNHDFVIRVGGDEFLIVFPYVDMEQAEQIWLRIKARLDRINETENRPYFISLSHGITDIHSHEDMSLADLISMADQLMYEEKQIIKKNFTSIRTIPEGSDDRTEQ